MTTPDSIPSYGWTAVVRSQKALLRNQPYINVPEPILVKDIPFPSDPLVTKVRDYAKKHLLEQTYNHSMRVYYFGMAILQQQFPDRAHALFASTYAMTCLLHDIGTTHANLRATQLSFEFYGGILALNLLHKDYGAEQSQAEAVCEAIIRHQDLGETGKITFLGQLIQLATVYDNMGINPQLVSTQTLQDVVGAFPRKGWSGCFAKTIREENGLKPWAHTTALGEREFPEGVEGNTLMAPYDK